MTGLRWRWVVIGVFVLLAVALVVPAVYLLARGDGNAEILVIAPSPEPDSPVAAAEAAPPSPVPELLVYVNGAVAVPGVYALFPGARVVDAVAAAGGAAPGADLTSINLALRVVDEGYYYIPREGETPPAIASPAPQPAAQSADGGQAGDSSPGGRGSPGSGSLGLIDLNTASAQELVALPGIGEVRAQAIVDYRARNGPFADVQDITGVSGIGSGIYEQVRDLVTVAAP